MLMFNDNIFIDEEDEGAPGLTSPVTDMNITEHACGRMTEETWRTS